MTASQEAVLRALGRRPMTAAGIATVLDARITAVQRTLDALYRRSLVTITEQGRWMATERGCRKVGAIAADPPESGSE